MKKSIINLIVILFILINYSCIYSSVNKPDTVNVILVQFSDIKWDKYWVDSTKTWQHYTYTHKITDFEALLTSLDTYYGKNCDGDNVFGSFRDYFWAMSKQTYTPAVNILNPTNKDGYPVWVNLAESKAYFDSLGSRRGFGKFINSARDCTKSQLNVDVSTSQSKKVCYIYAGNFSIGVDIATNYNEMAVPERNNSDRTPFEFKDDKLAHIGYFCHEFGHMMGSQHPQKSASNWALMRNGHKNGSCHGNIPAPMNPWFLYQAGWAEIDTITSYSPNLKLIYNISIVNKNIYYILPLSNNKKLLIENRQSTNPFDKGLAHVRVNQPGGILIWQIKGNGLYEGQVSLIPADSCRVTLETFWDNLDRKVFRPSCKYSIETNRLSVDSDKIFIKNDHVAIYNFKQNGDTIVVDFIPNYWAGTINSNEEWTLQKIPYHIGDHIIIPSGKRLTIEAGTIIKFLGNYKITVEEDAKILANGNETSPIVFTSYNRSSWDKIELNSDNNKFIWCEFKNGTAPVIVSKKITNYDIKKLNIIKNCTFR